MPCSNGGVLDQGAVKPQPTSTQSISTNCDDTIVVAGESHCTGPEADADGTNDAVPSAAAGLIDSTSPSHGSSSSCPKFKTSQHDVEAAHSDVRPGTPDATSVVFITDELNPRLAQAAVTPASQETAALSRDRSQSAVPDAAATPLPSSISQKRSLALGLEHVNDTGAAVPDPGRSRPKLPPMKLASPQAGTPGYEPSYSTYPPESARLETAREARGLAKSSLQFILDGATGSA
jgi:hypothetical protein